MGIELGTYRVRRPRRRVLGDGDEGKREWVRQLFYFYFWGPGLRYVELDIAIENVRGVLHFLGTQITRSTM